MEFETSFFEGKFESEQEAEATGLKGWSDLVMRGYGFEGTEAANLQFGIEYSESPEAKIIALHNGSSLCATLVLNPATYFGDYKSFGIHGIVVHPEFKGKGLGKVLYAEACKIVNPDIIAGSTKNPSALLARANGLAKFGMRTFYGKLEVTSKQRFGYVIDHYMFLRRYLTNKENTDPQCVVTTKSVDILLPDMPELEGYPDYIKESFIPVVLRQQELGKSMTAVMPLISIKESLLR